MATITLNVLIHGMHLIDIGSQDMMLYPPNVPNKAHIYRAGTWMQEKALQEGREYQLRGVSGTTRPPLPAVHPDHNAVFRRRQTDASLAHCSIRVPFPDTFASLRLTQERPGAPFFPGAASLYQAPSALPDVIVLTYKNVDEGIRLEPLDWAPAPKSGFANLHLWATPPGPTPPGHPQEEMQILGRMMGYPNLKMDTSYKEQPAPPPDAQTGVDGVSPEEELSWFERQGTGGGIEPRMTSAFDCLSTIVY